MGVLHVSFLLSSCVFLRLVHSKFPSFRHVDLPSPISSSCMVPLLTNMFAASSFVSSIAFGSVVISIAQIHVTK